MPRFSRDPLEKMVSLRLTQEQDRLLADLAASLGLAGGKAELLRRALDYWLEHAPEAREAQEAGRDKGRKKGEG
jgi:Arc/MetJ-type ribon-helix-helix transcriptional regulator